MERITGGERQGKRNSGETKIGERNRGRGERNMEGEVQGRGERNREKKNRG